MEWTRVTDLDALARWQHAQVLAHEHDLVALPADPVEDVAPVLDDDGERPGRRTELWSGTVDGAVVAAGAVEIGRHDNLDEAEIELTVVPSARARGHGAAAVGLLLARCRELGRSRVLVQVPTALGGTPSAGDRLAARCGFTARRVEVRRLLDLSTAGDWSALREEALAYAGGYEVTTWVDRAPAPAAAGLAALAGRMSTDAPQGGLAHEPEVWDAARWVAREDDALRRGRLHVGAHASSDGEVVAYTDLGVPRSQPVVGYQWDTLVRPDHRGHRLGLLLKVAAMRVLRAESPRTRWVNTWNAASNAPMIAINEALGFRPVDAWTAWDRRL